MDAVLLDLVASRADALGSGLASALLAHDAPHYRETPAAELRGRCDRLVAALVDSLRRGGPEPFVAHVRAIVEQRLAEGFRLREVQQALSSLEEQVWVVVAAAGGDTAAVVKRLAVVTGIVGRGKDELARAFVEQLERCDARASALQSRLDALFRGTEPSPQG
ncbi:MAG: hypothetical protein ACM3PV_01180 [Betaproteobacteria bacterium]